MNSIEYLGRFLSKITGKNPMACKGLIRLAMKREYGDRDLNSLDYQQLRAVCENQLSQIILSIFPSDAELIMHQILTRLEEIQSVFTLG